MNEVGKPKQYIPVFVSSTFEDLKSYRTDVLKTLQRMETIVHGMEYFGSKPGSPVEECLKAVSECNIYIGIFAMRYGSIDEKSGKSMTQLEYEEAQRLELPTLIYLIDEESQPILPKYVDTGEKAKKLEEFKSELKNKFTVSFFTTQEDLSRRITQDLPSALQNLGVTINKDQIENEQLNANDLYKKFKIRPKKYAGQEFIVEGLIGNEIRSVFCEDAVALNLTIGDAIIRIINFPSLSNSLSIMAEGKMADWLEVIETGVKQKMKIRLIFGTHVRADWTDDGPISTTDSVSGYKLMELV
ncbi:DUF4062 domain-containing protein [Clostridium estertheticum]|uniref:DUF4062 domain-containing protein n=1 Tax=Clostridium estertheticum TaxID=238834 RepID=UPI001C7DF216|nr:DUF4062 domain-containing protein [Clostridium estertheticum]MBX4272126.1 DUF4062 domain-containing protein [Clostridium estertheticum]WLC82496.1 DUF4062 domain-containing protein [Clostridium estertheticum]